MDAEPLTIIPMPAQLLTDRARNVQHKTLIPAAPGTRVTGRRVDAYVIDGDVAYLYIIG